jgi:antitoxin VapB
MDGNMYIPLGYTRRKMAHSRIFKNNRTQAVRLPKAVAFPDHVREVEIIQLGQSRLIVPVGLRWDDFFRNGPSVSEDFMQDREQPAAERREQL